MIQLKKSHIKIFSVLIALVFVGSCIAMTLTQSGVGVASAASQNIGVIDYAQVMSQHPGLATANAAMQKEVETAQADFEANSANMDDAQKAAYYQQTQSRLAQKQNDLIEPLQVQVEAAVKAVAEKRGLTVVIEKGAVVYGGVDITQDVIKGLK